MGVVKVRDLLPPISQAKSEPTAFSKSTMALITSGLNRFGVRPV